MLQFLCLDDTSVLADASEGGRPRADPRQTQHQLPDAPLPTIAEEPEETNDDDNDTNEQTEHAGSYLTHELEALQAALQCIPILCRDGELRKEAAAKPEADLHRPPLNYW